MQNLLSSLKISLSWEDIVHQYIVDNTLYPYNSDSIHITKNKRGLILEINPDNSDDIILRVGPETVLSDFKTAWDKIRNIRKYVPPRKRKRTLFIRNYEIFLMARDGKNINQICTYIEKKYGDSKDLDYGNIKKIVSEFYTRLRIPKKERPKLKTK